MFKKVLFIILLCLIPCDTFAKENIRATIMVKLKKLNYGKCYKMENMVFVSLFKDCIHTMYSNNTLTVGECNILSRKASNNFYYGCIMGNNERNTYK